MTRPCFRFLAIALTIALAAPLVAQKPKTRFTFVPGIKPGGGTVKITIAPGGKVEAEREDYGIFEGDVHVEYQDIKLRADKLTINRKTNDVTAEGNVIIDQGPTRVTASRALFNLDTKTGTFFQATGSMEPAMYFSGDEIEKVNDDTYVMTNGMFTSCELDRPAWSFHVKKARVTLDDYAHMQDVLFRTRIAPLFYTPRLIWPTKSDRSQGFLIPRLVLSSHFGARLETAYFIPFGGSADATLNADISALGYMGTGVDVRYRPSENVKLGDLYAYAVRDPHPELNSDTPTATGTVTHWRYRYQHAQDDLPGGFRGVVDVEDFSDLDFFRQYDRDPRIHTLSQIYSSAYLTKNTSRYSLNILTDRREILLTPREQRFEQLPSLQFRMYPQRVLSTPVYFSMESSVSHLLMAAFDRNFTSGELTRTSNTGYFRGDVFPTLSLQLRTPAWFSLRPQVSVRDTYYSASILPDDNPASPTHPVSDGVNRFYGQGEVELVGPSVSRIFNHSIGGFSRFKHVIEPRIQYIYTTNVANQSRLIRFDTVDSPFLPTVRDSVTYSLTQRLIGKEQPPKDAKDATTTSGNAREVMSFGLQQTVSLDKPFTTGTAGITPGTTTQLVNNNRFTPLVATLRVNPYQSITVDANANFGNVSHQIDQTSLSANLLGTGTNTDKYLGLTWFATFRQPGQTFSGSSQWRVSTGGFVLKDRLRLDLLLNYDATQKQFLEQRYIFGWTGSCYGISLGPRRWLNYTARGVKVDTGFEFSFSLKNVGSFGNVHP